MAKKVVKYVKLQIVGGKATPAPPVGPALGQYGLNIKGFCDQFNAATKEHRMGEVTPVVISIYEDKTFTFITKSPPASVMLKKAAGIEKGSSIPHTNKVGKVSLAQLREIALKKFTDMNAASIETAMKSIAGTARSMGLETEDIKQGAL